MKEFRPQSLPMPASLFVLPLLLLTFIGCFCRSPVPRGSDDAALSRMLIGEWEGSASIYNPRVRTNETIAFKNTINSDGTFSATHRIYDSAGHFIRMMDWGGTFIVSNRAVVCTITRSSEQQHLSPPKIEVEPIIRLDEHVMVIANESGIRTTSKRVLPPVGDRPKKG